MSEPAILAKLRETLEASLSPREAARVLLEALSQWGARIPSEMDELAAFASGPLRETVRARVDGARATRALGAIDDLLDTASVPTAEHDIPIEWEDEATHELRALESAVPVLVLASRSALADRLDAALGPDLVEVRAEGSAVRLERSLESAPAVVIVDASDPIGLPADALYARLVRLSATTTTIVWGAELDYGRALTVLADLGGRHVVGLRTADGLEGVLDLVLARRATRPRDDA